MTSGTAACIFCRIIARQLPAQEVYRSDNFLVIADSNPQAPEHLLVLPVQHVPNLSAYVAVTDPAVVGQLLQVAAQHGRDRSTDGFRLVVNEGVIGGQTVEHLHVHVLAGRRLGWPPG